MKQIHFELIDSTNTYLKQHYQEFEDLTFVSSNIQTEGKGRNNRKWDSDSNNLLFSILLKDNKYNDYINALSIISAYTIIKVLEKYSVDSLSIKWPNDIYYKDNKLCGILLESISKENIECLIIGVGLNVNQKIFDKEYIQTPTSLANILNKDVEIEELKEDLYKEFVTNLEKLTDGYEFYDEIISYDYLKNKNVYAFIGNEKKLVNVKGINKDFTLKVTYEESEYNVKSGEISFHI